MDSIHYDQARPGPIEAVEGIIMAVVGQSAGLTLAAFPEIRS